MSSVLLAPLAFWLTTAGRLTSEKGFCFTGLLRWPIWENFRLQWQKKKKATLTRTQSFTKNLRLIKLRSTSIKRKSLWTASRNLKARASHGLGFYLFGFCLGFFGGFLTTSAGKPMVQANKWEDASVKDSLTKTEFIYFAFFSCTNNTVHLVFSASLDFSYRNIQICIIKLTFPQLWTTRLEGIVHFQFS